MKTKPRKLLSLLLSCALLCMLVVAAPVTAQAATTQTYDDLMAAVQGETNANAAYLAFMVQASMEGYPTVAHLFKATAAAEARHAADEWALAVAINPAAVHPVASAPTVGTTAENLLAAFNGETYEWTIMYPGFVADATADGNTAAATLFTRTASVEHLHANNYTDALDHLGNSTYLRATFATAYLCPVCGAVFSINTLPALSCPVCGKAVSMFATYNQTYDDLMAAVQGETNANAAYLAFATRAGNEGYPEIACLFQATAVAEAMHAADEWALALTMNSAAVHPVASAPTVGTTAENLLAAFNGETYEWTIMYPGFVADATADGNTAATSLFTRTASAEHIHANNYTDALDHLGNAAYLKATFATAYLCPVCGAVFSINTQPALSCPVCGKAVSFFGKYEAPPAIPKLTSAANVLTGVKITWGKVSGATGYYVMRKTGTGAWVNIKKITAATTLSYTDTTAVSGTAYTYTVRAYGGTSSTLGSYNTTGLKVTYVATPKLTSAVNAATGVKFTWGKVSGATGYLIYRKTGTGAWVKVKTITSAATVAWTDTAVKTGTTYTYTAKAYKTSTTNVSASNTTGKKVVFVAMPKLTSLKNSKSGPVLKWGKITNATGYIIYRKVAGGSWVKVATITKVGTLTWTDKGASNKKTYYYTIKAYKTSSTNVSAYNTTGWKITVKK